MKKIKSGCLCKFSLSIAIGRLLPSSSGGELRSPWKDMVVVDLKCKLPKIICTSTCFFWSCTIWAEDNISKTSRIPPIAVSVWFPHDQALQHYFISNTRSTIWIALLSPMIAIPCSNNCSNTAIAGWWLVPPNAHHQVWLEKTNDLETTNQQWTIVNHRWPSWAINLALAYLVWKKHFETTNPSIYPKHFPCILTDIYPWNGPVF